MNQTITDELLLEPTNGSVSRPTRTPPGGRPLAPPRREREHELRSEAYTDAFKERLSASETRLCKAVLPNTTNHYNTLFGGTAMSLMDEVAFICATRFSRKRVVTASSDRIDFKRPIPAGTIIELVARVSYVGNTSLKVRVDILVEGMYDFECEKAISGELTFVAVDEHKQPISIL
ncbi:MAG: acyl-CoA thioesterase [Flavobacteriales bacterium]|nr:acyl-CoA thioesterase [Flavobacteriales bacterium]